MSAVEGEATSRAAQLPLRAPAGGSLTWVTIMVRNPLAVIGAAIVVLAFLLAVVGPSILPYDPVAPDVSIRLRPPSAEHLFGTDRVGRDILARVIEGLRVTLSVATGAVAIALLVGTPIGAIAGYYGRGVDAVLMRLIDALMAFPSRLLAIALVATMGASVMSLWWAIAVTAVPRYARIMRGGVLAQREREYVQAARVSGERDLAILFREILPNASAPILIQLSIDFAHAVLIESSLSFLGLGLAPPTISWGQMLNEAKTYMEFAPWTAIFPGAAISLLILGFNLFGDGLRDAFDPRNT